MNFNLKRYWLALSLPIKIAVVAVAVIAVAVVFSTIAGSVQKGRYEKKIAEIESRAAQAEAQAAARLGEANAAKQRAVALEAQLDPLNQTIAALESSLASVAKQSNLTRTVYVQSKNNPTPSLPLTGDTIIDRERLCAELASLGHPCR